MSVRQSSTGQHTRGASAAREFTQTARQYGAPNLLRSRSRSTSSRAPWTRGRFLCACSPCTAPTGAHVQHNARSPCTLMKSARARHLPLARRAPSKSFRCTPSANFTPLRTPFYCELRQNALAPLPEAAPAGVRATLPPKNGSDTPPNRVF